MFVRNISFYEKEKLLQNNELYRKGKFLLSRKEKFRLWNFSIYIYIYAKLKKPKTRCVRVNIK